MINGYSYNGRMLTNCGVKAMDRMINDVHSRVDEVQSILSKHGYPRFDINVIVQTLKPGVAGSATYRSNTICISKEYLKEHTDQIINRTVPHEICHLYVNRYFPKFKQHHGKEFRFIMNIIGADSSTYHNMKLANDQGKRKNKVTRYIYKTHDNSFDNVHLTPQQHTKQTNEMKKSGRSYFTYNGKSIVFTGNSIKL